MFSFINLINLDNYMSMSICQPIVISVKVIAADDAADVAVQRILSLVPCVINHFQMLGLLLKKHLSLCNVFICLNLSWMLSQNADHAQNEKD